MALNMRPVNGGVVNGYENNTNISYSSTSSTSLLKRITKSFVTNIDYSIVVVTNLLIAFTMLLVDTDK